MARLTHEEFVRRLRGIQEPEPDEEEAAEIDIQKILEQKFDELFGSIDDEDDD